MNTAELLTLFNKIHSLHLVAFRLLSACIPKVHLYKCAQCKKESDPRPER